MTEVQRSSYQQLVEKQNELEKALYLAANRSALNGLKRQAQLLQQDNQKLFTEYTLNATELIRVKEEAVQKLATVTNNALIEVSELKKTEEQDIVQHIQLLEEKQQQLSQEKDHTEKLQKSVEDLERRIGLKLQLLAERSQRHFLNLTISSWRNFGIIGIGMVCGGLLIYLMVVTNLSKQLSTKEQTLLNYYETATASSLSYESRLVSASKTIASYKGEIAEANDEIDQKDEEIDNLTSNFSAVKATATVEANTLISTIISTTYPTIPASYPVAVKAGTKVYKGPGQKFPNIKPIDKDYTDKILYQVLSEPVKGNNIWCYLEKAGGYVPDALLRGD